MFIQTLMNIQSDEVMNIHYMIAGVFTNQSAGPCEVPLHQTARIHQTWFQTTVPWRSNQGHGWGSQDSTVRTYPAIDVIIYCHNVPSHLCDPLMQGIYLQELESAGNTLLITILIIVMIHSNFHITDPLNNRPLSIYGHSPNPQLPPMSLYFP